MHDCIYVYHMLTGAQWKPKERVSDALGLEFQTAKGHPIRALGTKLKSSVMIANTLNH